MQKNKKHLREDDLDNLVEENMDVEEEERSRKESSKSHSSTSSADSVVSEQSYLIKWKEYSHQSLFLLCMKIDRCSPTLSSLP